MSDDLEELMNLAEQGNPDAQLQLGYCYDFGEGVSENKNEAFKWYHKSADQGDANAQYTLAHCYRYGEGVSENKKKAFKWYRKSAEQGDAAAQRSCSWNSERLCSCCSAG